MHRVLQNAVSFGNTLMLAQMLHPGVDMEGFDDTSLFCVLLENAPGISTVAEPFVLELGQCFRRRSAISMAKSAHRLLPRRSRRISAPRASRRGPPSTTNGLGSRLVISQAQAALYIQPRHGDQCHAPDHAKGRMTERRGERRRPAGGRLRCAVHPLMPAAYARASGRPRRRRRARPALS